MAGRFFNDEELEKALGLHLITEPPSQRPGENWVSICSRHREFDGDCNICAVGCWYRKDDNA